MSNRRESGGAGSHAPFAQACLHERDASVRTPQSTRTPQEAEHAPLEPSR